MIGSKGLSGALAMVASMLAAAVASTAAPAASDIPATTACAPWTTPAATTFTGLNPAIEGRLPLSTFKSGEVVEIDPRTMSESEARQHIRDLHKLGARVSIYLVGGHCDLGRDCDSLSPDVALGPTGSWNWDKSERRVLDITHPKVLKRLADGIESGWRLGANFVRIDNLHHPAGSTRPRTLEQMKTLIDLGHDIEDRLRADGTIPKDRVTGLVAHNNLVVWERLMRRGLIRRPPVLLTSERTGQLAPATGYDGDRRLKDGKLRPIDIPEIRAGGRIGRRLGIPYAVMEFAETHDLGGKPGSTYRLPKSYVDGVMAMPGVTEVVVVESESHYVGRGAVYPGTGSRRLADTLPTGDATRQLAACFNARLERSRS